MLVGALLTPLPPSPTPSPSWDVWGVLSICLTPEFTPEKMHEITCRINGIPHFLTGP